MRYTGHKSVNGVQIIDDGNYYAVIYNHSPDVARIETGRANNRVDHTTYSDASGNLTYEISVFPIRLKSGKIRRR